MSDTTGKALMEHWTWAAEKGLMNRNTAHGLRSACSVVLSALDDGESADVKTLDIEQALTRFQNLKMKKFKPTVLETYKRRFRGAVLSYLMYLEDPGGWKPKTFDRPSAAEKNGGKGVRGQETAVDVARAVRTDMPQVNMTDYPFPLREGQLAHLILPRDLKAAEVKRLSAFLATLAVDFE